MVPSAWPVPHWPGTVQLGSTQKSPTGAFSVWKSPGLQLASTVPQGSKIVARFTSRSLQESRKLSANPPPRTSVAAIRQRFRLTDAFDSISNRSFPIRTSSDDSRRAFRSQASSLALTTAASHRFTDSRRAAAPISSPALPMANTGQWSPRECRSDNRRRSRNRPPKAPSSRGTARNPFPGSPSRTHPRAQGDQRRPTDGCVHAYLGSFGQGQLRGASARRVPPPLGEPSRTILTGTNCPGKGSESPLFNHGCIPKKVAKTKKSRVTRSERP